MTHRPWETEAPSIGPHVAPTKATALAALDHPLDLELDPEGVERIASEGFPLWESVDVMVHRNRHITLAYSVLSRRLADAIAGPDGIHDANWCTFATWSSKTIGSLIEEIPDDDGDAAAPTGALPGEPRRLGDLSPRRLVRRPIERSRSATRRALAAGNRAVFLEVGLVVSTFLDHIGKHGVDAEAGGRWDACWQAIQEQLSTLAMLDPSWMLTRTPPPEDLRHGMHQYLKAVQARDQHLRSQHVLAGNLLVAAYEQRRVDGYVWAALALFTESAMQRLIRDRTGAVGGVRSWPTGLFARFATRQMTLRLGNEVVHLDRPILPPPDPDDWWRELATNAGVTLPVLQALITRYQLAAGGRPNRGATNWTSFDQRMRTIGNLFRLRQRQRGLFELPFDAAETARLLANDLHDDHDDRDRPRSVL